MQIVPYGSWTSSLIPESFSKGNCALICELEANEDGVFWTEQSSFSGRRVLFHQLKSGKEEWAKGHSVQSYAKDNKVHEYGGGSFQITPEGGIIFVSSAGLFTQESHNSDPILLLSSDNNTQRYADFSVTSSHIYGILEKHSNDGNDPLNVLVSINRKTASLTVIVEGADFYAFPRVSPDGKRIVWMEWNHINMPWDETSICLGDLTLNGEIENKRVIRSGKGINYHCPVWSSNEEIFLVNDQTNWWNVYKIKLDSDEVETNIYPIEKEIGHPCWQLADRRYASNGRQTIITMGKEFILLEEEESRNLVLPGYNQFTHLSITSTGEIYCIAAGPAKSSTLLKIRSNGKEEVIREARSQKDLEEFDISEPIQLEFQSDGVQIHGYFYKPKNRNFSVPDGSLPPVILMGHGGPTCSARPVLDLRKQFFTTRGFAIFDVDYRGSVGYGTKFRNLLKKQCGVADRDDMINGAKFLVSTGRVDPEKVCIMGASAGGFLLLNCLVASDIFKSAVSLCGVADIAKLSAITEKFERCYNEVLIGKYPEEEAVYYERTPTNHIHKISAAVAFLHGEKDKVVPVRQSQELFGALKERGVTTALQIYPGEGHGFRGAEAVKKSNEDSYYFLCKTLGISPTVSSTMCIVNKDL